MAAGTYVLPIADYPQFILNQYQEVGQKPGHTASPQSERAGNQATCLCPACGLHFIKVQ